jgi:hypothetical protein
MSECPSKRHWFRFSLRAVFVGITLAAILGFGGIYHVRWIGLRREFLNARSLPGDPLVTPRRFGRFPAGIGPARSAPGLLWLFGEPGQITLMVLVELDTSENISPRGQEQIQHIRGLFPEADIMAMRGNRSPSWFMANAATELALGTRD